MVYNCIKNLQSLLFPATCLLCGAAGEGERDLCAGCREDLPRNRPACRRCGAPLPAFTAALCGACLRRPPEYDTLFAPLCYRPPVDYLVRQMKFHGRLEMVRLLGDLLAEALADTDTAVDCILPVPLHPKRLAERGFDQALELARPVARRLDRPLAAGSLRRLRYTPPQTRLDARARRVNLRGAFALNGALPGRRVAVLDDVVTTGSTVSEITRVLRGAGAREVRVWAVARTDQVP